MSAGVWRRDDEPGGPARLVARTETDAVPLVVELARELAEPFTVLYVLLRSGTYRPEGRYQTAEPVSLDALENLLDRFGPFLARDGRHGLWIVSAAEPAAIGLDRRGRVEALGPVDRLLPALRAQGLAEGEVDEGAPNAIRPEDDREEQALLALWPWTWFPLEPSDELIE